MYFSFIKTSLFSFFFFLMVSIVSGQMIAQKVGDNPGFINSSAVLDLESSDKGFLPPRMTAANRDAIILPALGLIIYNTTSNVLEINTGTALNPIWTLATQANWSGDVTVLANAVTVRKINGVALNDLPTGLLKNTTASGIPSVASARTDYAEPTSTLPTGILKNTTGTGAHSIAVASDFPILNQNTTGNAATVTTNANLTGEASSVGNAVTLSNEAVISKTLTGYTSAAGTISAADNILQSIQKLDGNASVPSAVTVFTSSGTYTPSEALKWITVECLGAGAAGGTASATTASTNCSTSGGGGGGGYRKVLITKSQLGGSSFAITVGSGGIVNATTGAGGNGGASSFAALVRGNGGNGGTQSGVVTSSAVALGGAGGTSSSTLGTLIFSLNGKNGEAGYSSAVSASRFFKGGNGGDSFLGFGGINNIAVATNATTSTFISPSQYGGGGAGVALTGAARPLRPGQAGAPGVVIITEFF